MIKESPLMIKSKAFVLDIIKICKKLRHAKVRLLTRFCVQAHPSVQIYERLFSLTEKLILSQNFNLLLNKVARANIAPTCFWKADIITIKFFLITAPILNEFLFLPSILSRKT